MTPRGLGLVFLILLSSGLAGPALGQRFLSDDPLWTDPDRMDVRFPEPQFESEGVGPFEFLMRTFGSPGDYSGLAQNVNTLGAVPNSSWYTNRHYRFSMSTAELRRGPNEARGPSMNRPWRVRRILRGGLPRAIVQDATGQRFRILLDAPKHPEMATGAAMISSRLLYALGYNVPHHWLRTVREADLRPATNSDLTETVLDSLLTEGHQRPDSTYRVLVTRIPDVERRIGPFSFHGTRPDDGNDIFPHEARRELRGFQIIAAWLNYSNINRRHTLDVGVREDGRRFVRHYFTDLHLTLGSGGESPNPSWAGHEHFLEVDRVFKRMGTLGLSAAEWAERSLPEWPAVGHFEADHFSPKKWRPRWPNPAFEQCDPADAFWAAKKVRHFSNSDLETVVATAEYSSQKVADYIQQTLQRRRDSIGQAYLHWGGGLDRFSVRGNQLTFTDLREAHGLAPDTRQRTIVWHVYDNAEEEVGKKLRRTKSRDEAIPLPSRRASFLRVTLTTPSAGQTRVYLRRTTTASSDQSAGSRSYEVVGIDRSGRSFHE